MQGHVTELLTRLTCNDQRAADTPDRVSDRISATLIRHNHCPCRTNGTSSYLVIVHQMRLSLLKSTTMMSPIDDFTDAAPSPAESAFMLVTTSAGRAALTIIGLSVGNCIGGRCWCHHRPLPSATPSASGSSFAAGSAMLTTSPLASLAARQGHRYAAQLRAVLPRSRRLPEPTDHAPTSRPLPHAIASSRWPLPHVSLSVCACSHMREPP